MLSSAKIGTASWRYYQREVATDPSEYFLARGEAPGRWYGRGLPELGLAPDAMVIERDLESLLARWLHRAPASSWAGPGAPTGSPGTT